MERRELLKAGLGLACSPVIISCGGNNEEASTAVIQSTALESEILASSKIREEVQRMVNFGPRYTGFPAHKEFVNYLDEQLREAGLATSRDTYELDLWDLQASTLQLESPSGTESIAVDSVYPRSGVTADSGVSGPLKYLGVPLQYNTLDLTQVPTQQSFLEALAEQLPTSLSSSLQSLQGGVDGSVVVVELPFVPLTLGLFFPFITYLNDVDGSFTPLTDYKRSWITGLFVMNQIYPRLAEAGAAGIIFVFDSAPENTNGQYLPFSAPFGDVPAFIVNRDTGNLLKLRANQVDARMVLKANITKNETTDTLMATLPGMSDEVIIVNTHTDGPNVCEEDGAIGALQIARYYARLPMSQRPRTLVFSFLTGHMAPEPPEGGGFIDAHPDIMLRCVAVLTIEHLGMLEWLDDEEGYHPSGLYEPAVLFHSNSGIALPAVEAAREVPVERMAVCKAIGPVFFGVGLPFQLRGYPSVAYISGPNYLVAEEPDGGMSKFDESRMAKELELAIKLLQKIEVTPAVQLKAGDSTLLNNLPAVAGE